MAKYYLSKLRVILFVAKKYFLLGILQIYYCYPQISVSLLEHKTDPSDQKRYQPLLEEIELTNRQ
eukprot:snap_masked-scaffold_39-processed-gene-2.12-mRNA-1 protein AED:1.00 eAED:1.00 QI:0/0/0/0/1/1/3/0/64